MWYNVFRKRPRARAGLTGRTLPADLTELRKSRDVQTLIEYFRAVIEGLNRVDDIPDDWSNERRGEESLARARAIRMLEKVVEPFLIEDNQQDEPEQEDSIYYGHLIEQNATEEGRRARDREAR